MKLAYIGTYPPRECGIGTFTENLAEAMLINGVDVKDILVVAMNDHNLEYQYPPEVKLSINQEEQSDYLKAAKFINSSGADACVLEHRSEEHTSELQSRPHLVCRLLLEKKNDDKYVRI